jgi:hypothetical protein
MDKFRAKWDDGLGESKVAGGSDGRRSGRRRENRRHHESDAESEECG